MLFKIQNLNYLLIFLITLIALIGAAGLYSAAGGSYNPWASRHLIRFLVLLVLAILIAFIEHFSITFNLIPFFFSISLIGFNVLLIFEQNNLIPFDPMFY